MKEISDVKVKGKSILKNVDLKRKGSIKCG